MAQSSNDIAQIGRLVAYYRGVERLSARQLAEKAGNGLTQSVIANLESGRKRDLTTKQLLAVAFVLGVTPADLLFDLRHPYDEVEIATTSDGEPVTVAAWLARRWFGGEALTSLRPQVNGETIEPNLCFYEQNTLSDLLKRRSDLLFTLDRYNYSYSRRQMNEEFDPGDPLDKNLEDKILKVEGELYRVEQNLRKFNVDLAKEPAQPDPPDGTWYY